MYCFGWPRLGRHFPHSYTLSGGHRRVPIVLYHPAARLHLRVDFHPGMTLRSQVVSHRGHLAEMIKPARESSTSKRRSRSLLLQSHCCVQAYARCSEAIPHQPSRILRWAQCHVLPPLNPSVSSGSQACPLRATAWWRCRYEPRIRLVPGHLQLAWRRLACLTQQRKPNKPLCRLLAQS